MAEKTEVMEVNLAEISSLEPLLLVRQATCNSDFGALGLETIESELAEAYRKMVLESPQSKLAYKILVLEGLSDEMAKTRVMQQVNKPSKTFANQFEQQKKVAVRERTLGNTADKLHGILAFIQDNTNKPDTFSP